MEEKRSKEIKLSVALCTYNGAEYLREQLDSIAEQDVKVDEVIVCDDGSTDDTVLILREYADKKILPIKIVENNKQLGVIANFEQAILACTGDIIFCSDQDDIWMPYKTKVIKDYFKGHSDIDFVFSDAKFIDADGDLISEKSLFDALCMNDLKKAWNANLKFEIFNIGNRAAGCTVAFRKNLMDYAMPFIQNVNMLHDEQLAVAAIKKGTAGAIFKSLIKYRLHDKNVCGLPLELLSKKKNQRGCIQTISRAYTVSYRFTSTNYPSPCNNVKMRISFYSKRNLYTQTYNGKIKLLLSFWKYIYLYKQFFYMFYLSDVYVDFGAYIKKRCKGWSFHK